MCTLIAGVDILGSRTLVLGANRDESPQRASAGPGVLRERPRVVGGRDLVAGGTWLAIREARVVTALMNRRPTAGVATAGVASAGAAVGAAGAIPRSRGLLCLDAAALGPSPDAPHTIDPGTGERHAARLQDAIARITRDAYAACTLVGLSVDEPSWALFVEAGVPPRVAMLAPGWHVLTHADVDDVREPRTAYLRGRLEGFAPRDAEEALLGIADLLRTHVDPDRGIPGVCLHGERFPTVSSSLVAIGDLGAPRYRHSAGPPCTTPYADVSGLLGDGGSGGSGEPGVAGR
ncbi:MAG TPA: NRDE family protein [Candidatus Limnocylindrales bacterium]|nr:NRDE family protein [Candidatus Limnocylindrales bacterium]